MFPKANWALRGSCRSDGAASIRAGEAAIGTGFRQDATACRAPAQKFPGGPSVFVRAVVERVTTLCRARVRALRAR